MCCQDTMVQTEGMQFIHHHQCLKHQNESSCSSPQQGTFEQRGWLHPKWRYFQKSPYSAFVGFSRPESGQPGHFKNTLMNVTIRSLLCFKEETSDMGGRSVCLRLLALTHVTLLTPVVCFALHSLGICRTSQWGEHLFLMLQVTPGLTLFVGVLLVKVIAIHLIFIVT
jgi:hypothetical protein